MNVKLFFTKEKLKKVQKQCYYLLLRKETTLMKLTKLVAILSSTSQEVILARIEFWFHQQEQITMKIGNILLNLTRF